MNNMNKLHKVDFSMNLKATEEYINRFIRIQNEMPRGELLTLKDKRNGKVNTFELLGMIKFPGKGDVYNLKFNVFVYFKSSDNLIKKINIKNEYYEEKFNLKMV